MTTDNRKWRPLRIAIAWVVTRDQQFCGNLACPAATKHDVMFSCLQIETAMLEANCLKASRPKEPQDPVSHSLVPGYSGRFATLAQDYDQHLRLAANANRQLSVLDFLLNRCGDGFRQIMAAIADGTIKARGTPVDQKCRKPAGELPAASVTSDMWVDSNGDVWEGPQALTGEQPRRWMDVTVEWEGVVARFPAPDNGSSNAAPAKPDSSPGPSSTKELIRAAEKMAFPNGVPKGLTAKARRASINVGMKKQGLNAVSERTFQRYGIGKT